MKKIIHILVIIIIFYLPVDANFRGLGKIIQVTGDVDLTGAKSGIRIEPGIGSMVPADYKIRTGSKSYIEILLNDNTKIFMRELSVMQISNLRSQIQDPPTGIRLYTGKVRIYINKQLKGRNLILKTNAAMIGVKDYETDLSVITTDYETKVSVLEGKADIASSNRDIIKSYELNKKEEASIKLNGAPSEPVILPLEILDSWLDYYIIDKKRILVKGRQEGGIIDYILRKRKF